MIAVAAVAAVEPGVDVAAVVVVAAAVAIAAVEPEIEVATNFSPNFFSAYPHLKKTRRIFFTSKKIRRD